METISCIHHLIGTFRGEWDTKKGPGKSIKNALYIKQYIKRHLLGWSDVEQQKKKKVKPVALGIVKVIWVRRYQSVSSFKKIR